jgi:hypothetical protein
VAAEVAAALTPFFGLAPSGFMASGVAAATGIWTGAAGRGVGAATGAAGAAAAEDAAVLPLAAFGLVADAVMAKIDLFRRTQHSVIWKFVKLSGKRRENATGKAFLRHETFSRLHAASFTPKTRALSSRCTVQETSPR